MSFALAKLAAQQLLLKKKGVVGVGGSGENINVYVGDAEMVFPESIGGYNVKLIEVGRVRALNMFPVSVEDMDVDRLIHVRPALGGVSIGHPLVSAGTLATAITLGGEVYGLSNNHVIAAVNTLSYARAKIGDAILQPGAIDGGVSPDDIIGYLSNYVPLDEYGPNLVDAALFKPTTPDMLSPDIVGLSPFTGIKRAEVGMSLVKSGRTSSITTGKVIDIDATMSVEYGNFTAVFDHQIITDFMASPGDSGALGLDQTDYAAVSLVYAGSDYITMHNHIEDVIAALSSPLKPLAVQTAISLASIPIGLAIVALLR